MCVNCKGLLIKEHTTISGGSVVYYIYDATPRLVKLWRSTDIPVKVMYPSNGSMLVLITTQTTKQSEV